MEIKIYKDSFNEVPYNENCRKRNFKVFMFVSNKKSKVFSLFKKLRYNVSETDALFAMELKNGNG